MLMGRVASQPGLPLVGANGQENDGWANIVEMDAFAGLGARGKKHLGNIINIGFYIKFFWASYLQLLPAYSVTPAQTSFALPVDR